MRVRRVGDHLALELPETVAQRLGLREGDDVSIQLGANDTIEVTRIVMSPELARSILENLSRPMPFGYKFNREDVNSRDY